MMICFWWLWSQKAWLKPILPFMGPQGVISSINWLVSLGFENGLSFLPKTSTIDFSMQCSKLECLSFKTLAFLSIKKGGKAHLHGSTLASPSLLGMKQVIVTETLVYHTYWVEKVFIIARCVFTTVSLYVLTEVLKVIMFKICKDSCIWFSE